MAEQHKRRFRDLFQACITEDWDFFVFDGRGQKITEFNSVDLWEPFDGSSIHRADTGKATQ
jgi:hypothetical protein